MTARNRVTLTVGSVLFVIFISLLFCYQVRQSEVAFLTTFGKASDKVAPPGLHFRLPWPFQTVHKFDARVQGFEGKFEETLTKDSKNLLVLVYLGWKINQPQTFHRNFSGNLDEAKRNLESLVRSAKNAVVGQHPFRDFISTDPKELKFEVIEKEMLDSVRDQALANYGVEIKFLGIKRIGLPESTTEKVFMRMRTERERLVKQFEGEALREVEKIRSTAERERNELLARAEADAIRIRGQAEAEAAKAYQVFEKNPELAVFLQKNQSLGAVMKTRTTLIFDQRTPPFDLLTGTNAPARPAAK